MTENGKDTGSSIKDVEDDRKGKADSSFASLRTSASLGMTTPFTRDRLMRGGGHAGPPLRNHDHPLHPAMAFDGTPEVIDPRRQGHNEFKALAGGKGNSVLE